VVGDDPFVRWLDSLEARHLRDLRFPEVSRALRALSSAYVQRRDRIGEGGALTGAGKRAAFALFYAPLHFLLLQRIVPQLPGALQGVSQSVLVDLGCGTGAAGAAWAVAAQTDRIHAIDRNRWALAEAADTYRAFGLRAKTVQADVAEARLPTGPAAFLAAFTINELTDADRDALMRRLIDRASARGDSVLIVEPIARRAAPWWRGWQRRVEEAGGRADEWRFKVELPPLVAKLDRAAGLDHRELTGRTLWLPTPAADQAASS
jgi:predicted RNA methylase